MLPLNGLLRFPLTFVLSISALIVCSVESHADSSTNESPQPDVTQAAAAATDPAGKSRITIADDGKLSGKANGYAWVAGGTGTTLTTPVPCNYDGCFKHTHGQLCTRGEVAALTCTSPCACDWDTNWGVLIGMNATVDMGPWGAEAPTAVWVDYTGAPGRYRLMAHVAGDPESKIYCVEGYASGTEAPVGMFTSECWSGSGTALPSFAGVDKFGLMLLPEHSTKPFDYCITGVWAR